MLFHDAATLSPNWRLLTLMSIASNCGLQHSSLVDWDPMPLYSPEDTDPAPPMTPLLLGPDETSSSSEGEEGGSSDEEEGDAVPTSKQPQSQKQGQHAYLQG